MRGWKCVGGVFGHLCLGKTVPPCFLVILSLFFVRFPVLNPSFFLQNYPLQNFLLNFFFRLIKNLFSNKMFYQKI